MKYMCIYVHIQFIYTYICFLRIDDQAEEIERGLLVPLWDTAEDDVIGAERRYRRPRQELLTVCNYGRLNENTCIQFEFMPPLTLARVGVAEMQQRVMPMATAIASEVPAMLISLLPLGLAVRNRLKT